MSLGNCVLGKGFSKVIDWSKNDSLNFSVICLIEFKNNQTLLFNICEPYYSPNKHCIFGVL